MCRKDEIGRLLSEAGAVAWGVTPAVPLDAGVADDYRRWVAAGMHGEMTYLSKYDDVRGDPRRLLDGAVNIIVAAFPYYNESVTLADGAKVARYAAGEDYHDVLRRRLQPVVELLQQWGGQARVTVDTAPLRERHHAVKAGVGFIGRNNMLIVPRHGSYHFLAEILITIPLEPDEPCKLSCGDCGACVKACPGHALDGGMIDCRRCLSYLTIEYRGEELPEEIDMKGNLYGCDECQRVCPHNRGIIPSTLPEFLPRRELTSLSVSDIIALDKPSYKKLTKGSAMSRARLEMLRRNAERLLRDRKPH